MNIAFFLTPKAEVTYVAPSATMHEALELMERHRFTAVPLVGPDGHYAGTLTEGDLLWKMKNTEGLTFAETARVPLSAVPRRLENRPVFIDAEMEELLSRAVDQNFVPVIDSRRVFIGIVRRKAILEYLAGQRPLTSPRGP
jgi:CBS domain-containing protein